MMMVMAMAMMLFPKATKVRVAILGCVSFCSYCKKKLSVSASSMMLNDDGDERGRIS